MISLPWRINQTNEPPEKNWPDVKGTGAPPKAERFCIPSNSVCTPWVILAKSWSAKEPLILTNKQCLFTIKEKKKKKKTGESLFLELNMLASFSELRRKKITYYQDAFTRRVRNSLQVYKYKKCLYHIAVCKLIVQGPFMLNRKKTNQENTEIASKKKQKSSRAAIQ